MKRWIGLLLCLSMTLAFFGGSAALASEEPEETDKVTDSAAAESLTEQPSDEAAAAPAQDGEPEYVYELTTSLESGKKYLIVSSAAAGSAYALGHSSDAIASDAVTIRSDGVSVYIRGDDVDSTSVWTASGSSRFSFSNGGYYVVYDSSEAIAISTGSYSWTAAQNGDAYKLKKGGNYLAYSGGGWILSGSRTDSGVYLFEQIDTSAPNIKLDQSVLVLHRQNDPTGALTATVSNAPGAAVTWTSANSAVASVSADGTVTAKSFGTTTVTAAIEVNGTTYAASCEVTVTGYSESGYSTGSTYLAFGSDRHGVTKAIAAAMTGMPKTVSYVGLLGDMLTDGSYKASAICGEVYSFFDNQDIGVSITYGDHDSGLTADVGGVVQGKNGYGVLYTGYKNGKVQYYVYGFSMNYLSSEVSAETAADAFMKWVDGIDRSIPVFVVCHASVDTDRGSSSLGGLIWSRALNYAATGYAATESGYAITRNVIFLHGHNHTVTKTYNNWQPLSTHTVQNGESETAEITVYFSLVTAGYMGLTAWGGGSNVTADSMHATLAEITDDAIILTQYPAASPDKAPVLQTISRVPPQTDEPPAFMAARILRQLVGLPGAALPDGVSASAASAAQWLRR